MNMITNRYIVSHEKIDLGESKPPGHWKESAARIKYVEEKTVRKTSFYANQKDVGVILVSFMFRRIPRKIRKLKMRLNSHQTYSFRRME